MLIPTVTAISERWLKRGDVWRVCGWYFSFWLTPVFALFLLGILLIFCSLLSAPPHPPHGTHSYFGLGPFLRPCGCFLCNWKHTFCSFLCCSPCSWKLYFCFPPLIPWFQLREEDWVFSLWFWYRVWCTLAQIRWGKKPKQATTVIKNDPLGPSLTSTLTDFSYTFLMYRMYFNVK